MLEVILAFGACVGLAFFAAILFYLNTRYLGNSTVGCLIAAALGGPIAWLCVAFFGIRDTHRQAVARQKRNATPPPAPTVAPLPWHVEAYNLLVAIHADNQRPNGQTALRAEDERRLARLVESGRVALFARDQPEA
jgi:hypothetical protein